MGNKISDFVLCIFIIIYLLIIIDLMNQPVYTQENPVCGKRSRLHQLPSNDNQKITEIVVTHESVSAK